MKRNKRSKKFSIISLLTEKKCIWSPIALIYLNFIKFHWHVRRSFYRAHISARP